MPKTVLDHVREYVQRHEKSIVMGFAPTAIAKHVKDLKGTNLHEIVAACEQLVQEGKLGRVVSLYCFKCETELARVSNPKHSGVLDCPNCDETEDYYTDTRYYYPEKAPKLGPLY